MIKSILNELFRCFILILVVKILSANILLSQNENRCLILFNKISTEQMLQSIEDIKSYDVMIDIVTPPHTAVARMDKSTAKFLESNYGIKNIYFDKLNVNETEYFEEIPGSEVMFWNSLFKEKVEESYFADHLAPIHDDAVIIKEIQSLPRLSDTLSGRIAVAVFLPESNGSIDSSTENWDSNMVKKVFAYVQSGLDWWGKNTQTKAPWIRKPEFFIHKMPPDSCPISYEPITRKARHDSSEIKLWINEIMNGRAEGGNHFLKVYNFNKKIKGKYKTDWAFSIFAVNDLNDSDNRFADNSFAYAFRGGPYQVITYENKNYGINNMPAIVAHETAHIFGAYDEYSGKCNFEQELKGYKNFNCEDYPANPHEECIMKGGEQDDATSGILSYVDSSICIFTQGQIGWRPGPDPEKVKISMEPAEPNIGDTCNIEVIFKNVGNQASDTGAIYVSFPNYERYSAIIPYYSPDNSKLRLVENTDLKYPYVEWYDTNWEKGKQNTIKIKIVHIEAGYLEFYVRSGANIKGYTYKLNDPETSNVSDQLGNPVYVHNYTVPSTSLQILSANKRTKKFIGQTYKIEWAAEEDADYNILINLQYLDTSSVQFVIALTLGPFDVKQGNYNWEIMDIPPFDKYSFLIYREDNNHIRDFSDHWISITEKITLVHPVGNEGLNSDEVVTILWNPTGLDKKVSIEVIPEENNTFGNPISINPNCEDDGSYNWTVPNNLIKWGKMIITQIDLPENTDTSDNSFYVNNVGGNARVISNKYCGPGADSIEFTLPWWIDQLAFLRDVPDVLVFKYSGEYERKNNAVMSIGLSEGDAIDGNNLSNVGDVVLGNCKIWIQGSNITIKGLEINNRETSVDAILTYNISDEQHSDINIYDNVICGSGKGIHLNGTRNVNIADNLIGTDKSGKQAVPNGVGIQLQRSDSVSISSNVISGNRYEGISASVNRVNDLFITNNKIGLTADGLDTLPNGSHGIWKTMFTIYGDGMDEESDKNLVIHSNYIAGNMGSGIVL
ncbi:hypothetical protein ACFLS9_09825, partial [Bacteroidota bacterium]